MQFNITEMKELNAALETAFKAMGENVKKVQDVADKALDEAKKLGGTLEAKTTDELTKLGTIGNKLGADFNELRARVLDIEQKGIANLAGNLSPEVGKSVQELIMESQQYKDASKVGKMDAVEIGSFHKTQIVNATGASQPLVPAARLPGLIVPAEQRMYIRDLLPQALATSNLIEFASEASFTNNARSQGDASPGNVEGEAFAESAMTFTLANAALVTLGHWIPASRQVLSDAAMLQGHISNRLVYGLKLVEETQLLNGNGTAGTINGLCNQAAAFSRGASGDTILDVLLKGLLQVSLSNYEASGFVLNPVDWFTAMLLKDTTGRYLFSDPQSMVAPRAWAKPVVASQTMTQGKFLAGAFNLGAQIWDKEDATVRISENVDNHFIRNMVAILAEERLALTVYRSTAFVYGNTVSGG